MVSVKEVGDWEFQITMSDEEWDILNEILERENTTLEGIIEGFVRWVVENTDEAVKWIKENM